MFISAMWKLITDKNRKLFKLSALCLMMAVFSMGAPLDVSAAVTVDIKANGTDGTVTINNGDAYTYSWTSTGATTCDFTSPLGSSVSLSGSSSVSVGQPSYYPTAGSPVTITVSCSDGVETQSDSVVVQLGAAPAVTADIKANGTDGTVTINNGDAYTYSWSSTNATTCDITSPLSSSVTLSGSSSVSAGQPSYYPTIGNPVTITLTCSDGSTTATDSVVVQLGAGPAVTADVKANGSDGPTVTITNGSAYTYSWSSTGATVCDLTSPLSSSVTLSGSSSVSAGQPSFYPTLSTPVTITMTCSNGSASATDSVIVNLASSYSSPVTVDIKANGSDGPVTITNGDSYVYDWVSTGATTCDFTSPLSSSVTLSGSSSVSAGQPSYYPTIGGPVTITVVCSNGSATATDSVVINLASPSCPLPTITSPASVTVFTSNNPFSYSVGTTNASTTSVTGVPAGLTYSSSTGVISGDISAGNYTVVITATNPCGTVTQNVTIAANNASSGGGGGGGGGGSSRSGDNSNPVVVGEVLGVATSVPNFCPYLSTYMRMGQANDPFEVIRLQSFLKVFEGYDYVTVNGVFDQATFQAVSAFQLKYKDEILTPWGISEPTGYAYIRTVGKINQIICKTGIPAVHPAPGKVLGKEAAGFKEGMGTSTLGSIPVIGQNVDKGQSVGKAPDTGGPNGLAAALFSWPSNPIETLQCLYELLLILVVLYILGNVLESVLYKDRKENVPKRFYTKWLTVIIGLVVAFFGAYLLKEWCLLLPLLIAFIIISTWVWMNRKKYVPLDIIFIEKKPAI